MIKYRPTKSVDMEKFCSDVSDKLGALPPTEDLKSKVENYNQVLRNLVDDYSPMRSLKIKQVAGAPWFDKDYVELRKLRRSAEQRYRRSGRDADKKVYTALRKQAIDTSFLKKKNYVKEKLAKNPSKNLYSVVNQLIDREKERRRLFCLMLSLTKIWQTNFLSTLRKRLRRYVHPLLQCL